MQFSTLAVIAAAATAVSAGYNGTIVYTTDIVTAYTTYCPEATSITLGSSTYTVTEATTLTISDCPCTIVKPVTTSSVVHCNTCSAVPTTAPTTAPVYVNSTAPTTAPSKSVGTVSVATSTKTSATSSPSPITASSGNKAASLSGAALAGLVGIAAFVL